MATTDLLAFANAVATGTIRVIDLTQTLSPEFPTIVLPPEFGQCAPFRLEQISRYDAKGPAWYWNNFTVGEHTGTHFDAPIHWVSGKDLPDNAVDTIPPQKFIAPAAVRDCGKMARTRRVPTPKSSNGWSKTATCTGLAPRRLALTPGKRIISIRPILRTSTCMAGAAT